MKIVDMPDGIYRLNGDRFHVKIVRGKIGVAFDEEDARDPRHNWNMGRHQHWASNGSSMFTLVKRLNVSLENK